MKCNATIAVVGKIMANENIHKDSPLGISISKFHELVPVVENKHPHRLHARLEQTPSESHLQNSTKHTTILWGQTNFLKL